jgi:hypothetical protein
MITLLDAIALPALAGKRAGTQPHLYGIKPKGTTLTPRAIASKSVIISIT